MQFLWRSVKQCRSYCLFNVPFSYFSTLTFNISESIIAREIIPTGTCCIISGERDGTIKIIYWANIFFQNGCHIAKISTLSDFNENWYLGVVWRGKHDDTIDILFWASIFSKWSPYHKNFNFVQFQWKLISWGELMWRTWWYNVLSIFFPEIATILLKCHLCTILVFLYLNSLKNGYHLDHWVPGERYRLFESLLFLFFITSKRNSGEIPSMLIILMLSIKL